MINIEKNISKIAPIVKQLLSQEPLYFVNLTPSDIPEDISGVYAIFDDKSGEVLYVGRTKNLRRRLYTNHLHGSEATARLKKYLVEDEALKQISNIDEAKEYLKKNCYVKYIIEDDTLQRGKIEGLLSFLLDVRYIHEEH